MRVSASTAKLRDSQQAASKHDTQCVGSALRSTSHKLAQGVVVDSVA